MKPLEIVIKGVPRTKKTGQQIIMIGGHPRILQSKLYREYEKEAIEQIKTAGKDAGIESKVNVQCVFYRPTKGIVDLVGLLQGIDDILVRAGVLADDCYKYIGGHDGSRVKFDKEDPRTEILITEMRDEF